MGICSVGKTANICWERRVNSSVPQVPPPPPPVPPDSPGWPRASAEVFLCVIKVDDLGLSFFFCRLLPSNLFYSTGRQEVQIFYARHRQNACEHINQWEEKPFPEESLPPRR